MAAETDDFFRSRPFYDAEGVTHTLRIEGAGSAIALPLLVREIPGTGLSDAISPYGYPGAAVRGEAGAPPDPAGIDWSGTGLVSVFARERLGEEPCLARATERSAVQVHDPSRPRSLRSRFGEQIRRNRKLGYRVEVLPGPETSVEQRTSFHAVYTETMHRAEAAERYSLRAGVLRHASSASSAPGCCSVAAPRAPPRRGASPRSRTASSTTTSAAPPKLTSATPRSRTSSRR